MVGNRFEGIVSSHLASCVTFILFDWQHCFAWLAAEAARWRGWGERKGVGEGRGGRSTTLAARSGIYDCDWLLFAASYLRQLLSGCSARLACARFGSARLDL